MGYGYPRGVVTQPTWVGFSNYIIPNPTHKTRGLGWVDPWVAKTNDTFPKIVGITEWLGHNPWVPMGFYNPRVFSNLNMYAKVLQNILSLDNESIAYN